MEEYQKPYLLLFNAITDSITQLCINNYGTALQLLISAQQEAEDYFISEDEEKELP